VDRRTLPLFIASSRSEGADETEPLDRLRMQKGVFLLERRGPEEWREAYAFGPYNWGPYSGALNSDLAELVVDGLLTAEHRIGRYPAYRTTALGEKWLNEQLSGTPDVHGDFVKKTRRFVTTRSFSKLLRDVYAAYPKYATRSRFTG
jgi:uncharacterized protein YwgA